MWHNSYNYENFVHLGEYVYIDVNIFFQVHQLWWENYLLCYRVSHETWQLVNSFECRLPYIVLYINRCLQFVSFKKSFAQICFTLNLILLCYNSYIIFLLLSLVWNNLTNYGRRHSKIFTNCYVTWDTPCITFGKMPLFVKNGNAHKYYFHAAFLIV